ncbi:ImmA/IrrE family metallo-endopeptidase [Mesorhizobium sp. M2A.F.Ca.ET.037.01.1.1]|uniref:ATP-dependent helicase n=1 Tax=unclassified Mesorhizobium TaxID=325217 RepID=UPI000FCA6CAA|nr:MULTISPECIES: ATP-dependent helicase [unclassified Mesorhizobium]RUX23021.1 ImmA/IrrE family metallo-endopeptidase [Mesorhizobium sp. M2A.F.Ca.ET.037.01.1.1]RUY12166.1 ImmA/IrrE family metallo-endopeptidase [Mesorhizobium sp. M2A.F.Ca.ET.040.01.1.1]RWA91617.1 MAG: ImmA/IrrE family metallo-endopeptidase [Mesorhizobium sp.]TIV14631.1 MAG: ImmA/IrrE family metallo-endopeptidase [Mesorhizobium sp.]
MEAFELIRRQAAALHENVVAAGANPFDIPKLVFAAAGARDLEISFLPDGDPGLKGARALLDDQGGVILCQAEASDIDRALLVAHEIGHDVIHSGSSACSETDVDPSQSIEPAPVGLQRVEDYGARERRELHANVFARELVLPRSFAARLHREDGLGADAVASRLRLPVPLVRQQILDALLLPQDVSDEPTPPVVPIDDLAQDRAVLHRDTAFQLEAGPGTGKTRTLVKRIVSLIEEGADPASILVLTFSNRAAGELAERIAGVLADQAAKIWIGTFHSFGLDLLRRYGGQIGLPSDPDLFDRSDAITVLEEVLPTLGLKHYRNLWDPTLVLRDVLSAISRAKDEVADNARYRELAVLMKQAAGQDAEAIRDAEKCLEIADIYDRYEIAKQAKGSVDFGDLIMLPAKLLENLPPIAAAVRLRHRHVLVDEYQDVNHASVRLLKGIAGDGPRLWVVGDARQSIYRFRGASSDNMTAFTNDFPGATTDALERSYRSTEAIIGSFTSFSEVMNASKGMHPLRLETNAGPGEPCELRVFDSLDDEIAGIAASVKQLEGTGVRLRDQAVLCRTNKRLNEIAAGLAARGIPVLHLGSLFERDEVRDLLSIMSLAVDGLGSGIVRVAAMPRYAIPLQDVYRMLRILKERNGAPMTWLHELASDDRITDSGRRGLARLAEDLSGLRQGDAPWDFVTGYLLDWTDLVREMASRASVSDWMRSCAIWQFLNFLRDSVTVGHGSPMWKMLERVRQLVLLAEERDLRQVPAAALGMNAVRLMTIHGSKGLEFEAVHLPGMTEVSIPSSYRGIRCPPPTGMITGAGMLTMDQAARLAHESEEECLAFVAMSRAKRNLRFYLSRTQPNGNARRQSSFLAHIRGLKRDDRPPMMTGPDGRGASLVQVTVPVEYQVTDRTLGSYLSCPRRYFYTHVLGLGGGKRPTAFTQTHQCLYELIKWLHVEQLHGTPSTEEVEARFDSIWQESDMPALPAAADYRGLASNIVRALLRSSNGRSFHQGRSIAIDLQHGRIVIQPDAIAELADGTMVLRRVRTGHKRSSEYSDPGHIEYGLYIHAGRAEFGSGSIVEAVHLTDDTVEPVELTDRVIGNRVNEANRILGAINAGRFEPDTESMKCARCPHFFVCAAMPSGYLVLDDENTRD